MRCYTEINVCCVLSYFSKLIKLHLLFLFPQICVMFFILTEQSDANRTNIDFCSLAAIECWVTTDADWVRALTWALIVHVDCNSCAVLSTPSALGDNTIYSATLPSSWIMHAPLRAVAVGRFPTPLEMTLRLMFWMHNHAAHSFYATLESAYFPLVRFVIHFKQGSGISILCSTR